jgi:hypothetical protein
MERLRLSITQGSDKELMLGADNMNEMVDKIIEWQLWENQPLDYFEKKGRLEKEKNSGFYYFKNNKQ